MLEWMNDETVLSGLQAERYRNKSLKDCKDFIIESHNEFQNNCHMAIVDDNDIYQGTVSLKNIDYDLKEAEFAIVLRKNAQSKGYGKSGLKEILDFAFLKLGLEVVYWNVLQSNEKAIRLYENFGAKILPKEEITGKMIENAPGDRKVFFYKISKNDWKQ